MRGNRPKILCWRGGVQLLRPSKITATGTTRQNYQLYLTYYDECFNGSASLQYLSRAAINKSHYLTVAIQLILPLPGQQLRWKNVAGPCRRLLIDLTAAGPYNVIISYIVSIRRVVHWRPWSKGSIYASGLCGLSRFETNNGHFRSRNQEIRSETLEKKILLIMRPYGSTEMIAAGLWSWWPTSPPIPPPPPSPWLLCPKCAFERSLGKWGGQRGEN